MSSRKSAAVEKRQLVIDGVEHLSLWSFFELIDDGTTLKFLRIWKILVVFRTFKTWDLEKYDRKFLSSLSILGVIPPRSDGNLRILIRKMLTES
jgi:hypothetical protein